MGVHKASKVSRKINPCMRQYAQIRRMKEIPVEEVADKIGTTVGAVRSYESGRRTPTLRTMDLLCRAVGADGITVGSGW